MASSILRCLLLVCLVYSACSILIGRLRQSDKPASNVVPSSAFMFPSSEDETPECKTDHGYPGRCVDIRACFAARMAVRARSHPVRCGWINNHIPRVCCHPDQIQHIKMVFRSYRDRRRNRSRAGGMYDNSRGRI